MSTSTDRICPLEHGAKGAPNVSQDRYVCPGCVGTLRGLLTDLHETMADLDTALAKQSRFTAQRNAALVDAVDDTTPLTAAVTQLPFATGPSEAGWVARQTILSNVDWVTAVRGHVIPQRWSGVGTYLTDATEWLARHPDGPQVIDELTAAIRNARRAIDRPADQHYLGLCAGVRVDGDGLAQDCHHPLYAPDTTTIVTCPRCTTQWPTGDLNAKLLARIEDHQLTAIDAERVLAEVGIPVPAALIRLWKHRKEIEPRGVNAEGRPLYRVGDILTRNGLTDTGTDPMGA